MATFVFIENGRIRTAPGTRIIKAAEYSAMVPAQKVYDEARSKAAEILKEAESVYQSEKQKGYQDGLRQARQEMAEQMTTLALRTAQYHRSMEKQIVQLVMEIVNKVLHGLDAQTLVVAQVKKALTAFKGSKHLTIKTHPAVAELLKERFSEMATASPAIGTIDVKGVSHLSSDTLVLESETAIVEASLKAQLKAIEDAIHKELQLPN
jgi:type III secretion protein L